MSFVPERPARKSPRLKGYDYGQEGAYFVTICTHRRECLFGQVVNGEMLTNEYGDIVQNNWNQLLVHYQNIELDVFVVMPNHIHGIVVIVDDIRLVGNVNVGGVGEGLRPSPTGSRRYTLSEVVRAFKAFSARDINQKRGIENVPVWQRSFHDHIIRHEPELNILRQYVESNPASWQSDVHYQG